MMFISATIIIYSSKTLGYIDNMEIIELSMRLLMGNEPMSSLFNMKII